MSAISDTKPQTGGIQSPTTTKTAPPQVSNDQAFEDMAGQLMGEAPKPPEIKSTEAPVAKPEPSKEAPQPQPSPEPVKPVQTTPVVQQPTGSLQNNDGNAVPRGFDRMNSSNVVSSEWKIIQKSSDIAEDNLQLAGKLHNTGDDSMVDSAEFIFLDFHEDRTYFNPDDRSGSPLCTSDDGKRNTAGTLFDPISQSCSSCPHAQWNNGKPPQCTHFFRYPVLTTEQVDKGMPIPSVLMLSKTSLASAVKFNSMLMSLGVDIFANVFKVSTTTRKGKSGNSFVPVFEFVRQTTDDEKRLCNQVYGKLQVLQTLKSN